jgi:predicted aldo/keto reductase-like oxidoreductase
MSDKPISRRKFVKNSTAAISAISALGITSCATSGNLQGQNVNMPMRSFGKTGEKISILGYGGGSQFLKMPDGEWEPHMEFAFNSGVTYFDTASVYKSGDTFSENRFSRIIPKFRKKILLTTKVHERDPEKAKREFEDSLSRLNLDQVDILLIHAIQPEDKVADLEKGVYKLVQQFKDQKMTRFIGFSSMDSAERSRELIEKLDFDVTLLAMNPTKYGDFIDVALPAANQKNLGVICMKVMRNIIDQPGASASELLEYSWNLPGVACTLVSQTGLEPLQQNLQIAYAYGQKSRAEYDPRLLERKMAHLGNPDILEWARPGYTDGVWS